VPSTSSAERAAASTVPEATKRQVVRRLVLGSFLMLFLELALIRWLGSNVAHLSYFSNFVLLGSFLGIGLGFLIARRPWSVVRISPLLLAFLAAFVATFPVTIDQTDKSVIYFTSLVPNGPPAWVVLPLVFGFSAAILAGPAEIVGRCFQQLKPLEAYRSDLVGSLLGIAVFSLFSFLRAPSVAWGAVVGVLFVVLLGARNRFLSTICGSALVAVLAIECLRPGISWSPYYKVATEDLSRGDIHVVGVSVNGVPHQTISDAQQRLGDEPQYGLPYAHLTGQTLDDVLVIGAGSGTDVAISLVKGAKHVDAVDIDPRIVQIGEERHPNRPYQDDRVTQHVNDGRAFLSSSAQKYDLILFALPDSLALVNGASQIRLESYLFTQEAIASAHDHLKPDGLFAMYNFYREDWLIQRLAGTVQHAFGHPPCVDLVGGGQAVVAAGMTEADQICGQPAAIPPDTPAPVTDDHPFLYFKGGMIPALYLWVIGGILLVSLIAVRTVGGPVRRMRPYLDLFFMGAAFLLLETKSVATFALLFGTTWFVNALVFAGVLVVVLLAVEVTARLRTPPLPVVFTGIAASLGVAYAVRPEWLLALPAAARLVIAVVLAFTPIFLANVAFAKRFASETDSPSAFAVNLLGALLGGCLEYLALLTGYRNLLLVVLAMYALAFLFRPRSGSRFAVPIPAS
jgi:SAM-dependent methyltransferase